MIAAVAVTLALAVSVASANTQVYRLRYVAAEAQQAPQDAMLGPGGARKLVVNFTAAAPQFGAKPNEITAITNVEICKSTPASCGLPAIVIDNATQFTLDWGSECPTPNHIVIVTVTSTGVQANISGSWKDNGNVEVGTSDIDATPCAPALSPFAGAALVLLVGSTGLFVLRRRASALA
jgi:hypothetical protein